MNGIYGVGFRRTILKQTEMSDQRTTGAHLGRSIGGTPLQYGSYVPSGSSAEISPPESHRIRGRRDLRRHVSNPSDI